MTENCDACTCKIGEGYQYTETTLVAKRELCPHCYGQFIRDGWIMLGKSRLGRVTLLFTNGSEKVIKEKEKNRIALQFIDKREQMINKFKRLPIAGSGDI